MLSARARRSVDSNSIAWMNMPVCHMKEINWGMTFSRLARTLFGNSAQMALTQLWAHLFAWMSMQANATCSYTSHTEWTLLVSDDSIQNIHSSTASFFLCFCSNRDPYLATLSDSWVRSSRTYSPKGYPLSKRQCGSTSFRYFLIVSGDGPEAGAPSNSSISCSFSFTESIYLHIDSI